MEHKGSILKKESFSLMHAHSVTFYELPNIPFFNVDTLTSTDVDELYGYIEHGKKLLDELDSFLLSQKRTFNQNVKNMDTMSLLPSHLRGMQFPEAL